jgi:hypothetical protein
MTAHELAELLKALPDLPVVINGWGSEEGLGPFIVDCYWITEKNQIALDGDKK